MGSLLRILSDEIASIVEQVKPALVQVRDGGGWGTGTIWHPDGLVVTNAHVARHQHLEVALQDGRIFSGRLLARDPARDLAALAVEASGLSPIPLGDSGTLRPGDWLVALGYPWGVPNGATAGAVIGVGPALPGIPLSEQDWIAISLHLRPGHSGGALVDGRGRLVGINTVMSGPDVGMAVPVHAAKRFLRQTLGSAAFVQV